MSARPSNASWWREGVLYQIYPRSFADSTGDGIGDLRGIVDRLDYLAWLGVAAIWLNPITASPDRDWGYDVSDFRSVHPDWTWPTWAGRRGWAPTTTSRAWRRGGAPATSGRCAAP